MIARSGLACFASVLVLSLAAPMAFAETRADSVRSSRSVTSADVAKHPPVPHLLHPSDMMFLAGATGVTALAMHNDEWFTREAIEAEKNPDQRRIAKWFRPLGSPTSILGAALVLHGIARFTGRDELARRATRIGLSVGIAASTSLGLKSAFGRERPEESPENAFRYRPFSGKSSFPSGHAVTAFATAAAIDRETSARWIPYVVYPAATMVGWSRVHDRKHWTSDVVAGAAIGGWMAWKTESFLAHRALGVPDERKKHAFLIEPHGDGFAIAWTYDLDR